MMMIPKVIYSVLLSLAAVSSASAGNQPQFLNSPVASSSHAFHDIFRALRRATIRGRDNTLKNTTNIAKSWDGATLFSLAGQVESKENITVSAGVEVTCTTCYVKGLVTAEIGFAGEFDAGQAIANFTEDITEDVQNITKAAVAYLEDTVPGVWANLTDDLDFDDIDFPPLNVSFNLDVPDIPECHLRFQLDGLELYMLLDTVLSAGATYTLNLYSTNTPIGISVDSDTFIGVIVSIDLILSTDGDIDISSGLHIKLDDGVAFDLSLFGQNVSSVTFNGGSFEFLPVSIQSASGVLTALLRVGMHAGVSLEFDPLGRILPASTGTEVLVYADLAEFTTNITAVPDGDDSDCQLHVQQVYQLALGAAAGATLVIGLETWGPSPSTKVPIFYTTLADVCGETVTKTASPTVTTPPPSITARAEADMTTTTVSEKVTFTGIICLSTGLVECPATLQSTTKITSTKTLVLTVSSGSDAVFPPSTQDTVPNTVPFAANVKTVAATSGSPVSYVPPPPPPPPSPTTSAAGAGPSNDSSKENPVGKVAGVDTRLIIGVTVGVGVPFLAAVIAATYFLLKRRKYARVPRFEGAQVVSPQDYTNDMQSQDAKKPGMSVTTISRASGT
ncbi:hypothetical protein F5Y19DRAFT_245122 [Xylariaceae sp. FL1651]|nr:hypothetical protein F5Y19DRAFT_245122 [Xylariaceae sp. FL1651]